MTGLYILAAIVLIIVIICRLRIGVILQYAHEKLEFIIKIAFVRITVYST